MSGKEFRGGNARIYRDKFFGATAEFGFQKDLRNYTAEEGDSRFGVYPYMLRRGAQCALLDVSCYIFSKTWYSVLNQLATPDDGYYQLKFLLSHVSGRRNGWLLEMSDDVDRLTDEIIEAFRNNAIPFFRSCTTVDQVLAIAEEGRYVMYSEQQALEQVAKYRQMARGQPGNS